MKEKKDTKTKILSIILLIYSQRKHGNGVSFVQNQ